MGTALRKLRAKLLFREVSVGKNTKRLSERNTITDAFRNRIPYTPKPIITEG